jgi:hypothetical protein
VTDSAKILSFTDCAISGNAIEAEALGDGWAGSTYGGGLYVLDSVVTLDGCVVEGNTGADEGGGLYVMFSEVALVDSEVRANVADDDGAGIYVYRSPDGLSLTRTVVSENEAGRDGGGLFVGYGSTTRCDASTLEDNAAGQYGGGAYVGGNTANLLTASTCAWGTGASDNAPADVYEAGTGELYAYGSDASFTCTGSAGCTP